MSDIIIKGRSANNEVRFFAAYSKELVEKARTIHNTSPICTAALGRLLTAGAMMGTMAKNETDMLTLTIEGTGPARKLTVTADSKANVKGIIAVPVVDLPPNLEGHLNVGDAIGDGFLRVIRDAGLKEPYVGQTNLVTGEIAEDLTYYFATSEQIPTSVGLGVLMNADNTVSQAGGFIIQLMPFVMAFNPRIKEVVVDSDGATGCNRTYRRLSTEYLEVCNNRVMKATIGVSGQDSKEVYCLCSNNDEDMVIIPPTELPMSDNMPSLFLYYPLLGTEDFGTNFVQNSLL